MRKLEQMFHRLRKIVLALAGAHEEVLAIVPSERARFESLGWAILITSGVAAVSMWFALASAVGINGILALPIALAWGLVIMGIDRWLIVSMPVDGRRKFAMAVPRLALALLLGTLISTPLVLRIFQSEINAQIAKMQQQSYSTFLQQQQASDVAKQVGTYSGELQYLDNVIATHGATTANTVSDPELRGYNEQLTNLNNELTHWTSLKNQYYNDYICQLYGGPTCPKKGNGPAAKASQQNYNAASQEVDTLEGQINQVQGEIQQRDAQLTSNSKADQQARYQQALTQQPIVKDEYDTALQRQNELQASFFASNQAAHGILIRLEALSQLSNGNFTVTAARFLLFLLFLVIECLPVTVKLLQQPGLYEEALEQAREAERRDVNKFYSFRSRLSGPNGTAVLRPMLRVEPDYRIDAIWTPTRALPGSVASEDDQPTEADSTTRRAPWAPGERGTTGDGRPGRQRSSRAALVRRRPLAQPLAVPARRGRPSRRLEATRRDGTRARPAPAPVTRGPGGRRPRTRRRGPATTGPTTTEGATTARDTASGHRDEGSAPASRTAPGTTMTAGQTARPPMVSPGSGGTPLNWDEDE